MNDNSLDDLRQPCPHSAAPKRRLSVREASNRLQCSRSEVYALCAAGEVEHVRVGRGRGRIQIAEEAIERYLRARTVGVGEAPPARDVVFTHRRP